MEKFTDHLEAIEAAAAGNGRLTAIAVANGKDWRVLPFIAETVNPFITFGVQKLPEPRKRISPDGLRLAFEDDDRWLGAANALAAKLQSRELSGGAAQEAIQTFLESCKSEAQLKWGRRYVLRDLRINVGAKALRKTFGTDCCPLFEVPLATDFRKLKKMPGVEGDWVTQPKLDGARCVAFVDAFGNVELLSRTGKTWKNFESIRKAIANACQSCALTNVVFDGEVVSLDPDGVIDFQALQSAMMRHDGNEYGFLQYVIFDACTRAEWESPTQTYAERYANVASWFGFVFSGGQSVDRKLKINESRPYLGSTTDDLDAECRRYVSAFYEGAIVRRADVPVENKRSRTLVKVKTFTDVEVEVTGIEEGEGKREGACGALVCKFTNGKTFKVGSGLTDKQCEEFMAAPPVGRQATIKYFELTDDEVPRHPVFKCLRAEIDFEKDDGGEDE